MDGQPVYVIMVTLQMQKVQKGTAGGGLVGAPKQAIPDKLIGSTNQSAEGIGRTPAEAYKAAMVNLGRVAMESLQIGDDGGVVEGGVAIEGSGVKES